MSPSGPPNFRPGLCVAHMRSSRNPKIRPTALWRLVDQEEMPAALITWRRAFGQGGRQHPRVQHRHAWIVVPRADERRLFDAGQQRTARPHARTLHAVGEPSTSGGAPGARRLLGEHGGSRAVARPPALRGTLTASTAGSIVPAPPCRQQARQRPQEGPVRPARSRTHQRRTRSGARRANPARARPRTSSENVARSSASTPSARAQRAPAGAGAWGSVAGAEPDAGRVEGDPARGR